MSACVWFDDIFTFHSHRCICTCIIYIWPFIWPNLKWGIVDILDLKLHLRNWLAISPLTLTIIRTGTIFCIKGPCKSYIDIFLETLCKMMHLKFSENIYIFYTYHINIHNSNTWNCICIQCSIQYITMSHCTSLLLAPLSVPCFS